MIINVSSKASLLSALSTAKGGDTIKLGPGSYEYTEIKSINPDGNVTITSADPANPAVIAGLGIGGSSNLTLTDLEVTVYARNHFGLYIASSNNIRVENFDVHGAAVGDDNGVRVIDSQNVTITGSDFHHLHTGINHQNSDGLVFSNNTLHDIRSDGIRGGGSSNVVISGNHFTNFYPADGDHPDAIQFWTVNTTTASRNILISDNVFVRGEGSAIQGIFVGNELKIPYENVTITGNAIIGGLYQGINLSYGKNILIENNFVQGYSDYESWITMGVVTDARAINNYSTSYVLDVNVNAGVASPNNVKIPLVFAGDNGALDAWRAAQTPTSPDDGTPSPDDTNNQPPASTPETPAADPDGTNNQPPASTPETPAADPDGTNNQPPASTPETPAADPDDTNTPPAPSAPESQEPSSAQPQEPAHSGVAPQQPATIGIALRGHGLLRGNDGNDSLTGDSGDDELWGGAGNDSLAASHGANYLRGEDGNDTLVGGAGFDNMNGNAGEDSINGGLGHDWVLGGRDSDRLDGGDGDDIINGNLGDDTAEGGTGADTVRGGQGNDYLHGGAGDDWLFGDRGDDQLTGGAGADVFHVSSDGGTDYITDFMFAEGDRVHLEAGLAYTVTQNGSDAVVNLDGGSQLVLQNVELASLTDGWITVG